MNQKYLAHCGLHNTLGTCFVASREVPEMLYSSARCRLQSHSPSVFSHQYLEGGRHVSAHMCHLLAFTCFNICINFHIMGEHNPSMYLILRNLSIGLPSAY